MHIRLAQLADLERLQPLFDLYRQFYNQSGDPQLSRPFLQQRLERQDSRFYLAEDEDGMQGFVQLFPSFSSLALKPIWILNDLYVAATARQKGVGQALVKHVQEEAERLGVARLEASTRQSNFSAQRFYEAMGFEQDRTYFYYYLRVQPQITSNK